MISSSTNEKQTEWNPTRSVRRFPENNNITNNNNNNTNNNVKKFEPPNNQHRLHQDCESDLNHQNLLASSIMKSSNLRPCDSDPTSNISNRRSRTSDSSSNTLCEEMSFTSLINSVNKTSPLKAPKPNLATIHKMGSPKPTVFDFPDSIEDDESLVSSCISKGQYLMKQQWNSFIGNDDLKKYPKRVIERNDNIWEMVSLHYGCLNRLVILRDVYSKSYPYLEAGSNQNTRSSSAPRTDSSHTERHGSISDRSSNLFESIESIVPGLDRLIHCFVKITDNLVNNHLIRPDRVITDIGRVLNDSINDQICAELAKLYGHFNFQRQISSQKIIQFKKYPSFLSYIHKCERDPRSEKKSLSDIIQDISMFWARMTVPLNNIIEKTMNDTQEVNYLTKYREKIQKLIKEAENIQGKLGNSQILKNIVENYETTPDCPESDQVQYFMTADNATLLYKGEVQFELKKNKTGTLFYRELTGVALENCLFFLSSSSEPGKTTCKYQLFKDREMFPPILEWGKQYGYFREEDSKNNNNKFSFYVIIEKPEPSIKRLFVSTTTERNCWKNCMVQGFSRWTNDNSSIKDAEDKLKEEMKNINIKWNNTQHGIELIKNLDNSLKAQLEYRTVGFRVILEEELKRLSVSARNSNTSSSTVTDIELKRDQGDCGNEVIFDTYLPDLSSQEGINDWLDVFVEWVNRLKFSLCSSGANITRSASEIEARKRPSIQTVKKCETFTSHDSPTYEKRPADVPFLNPPITKQKKDQRRISVTGIANLFRINSKFNKHDEAHRGFDHMDPVMDSDKDLTDLAAFDGDMESDSFISSLSKDTVAAFNEINVAAKNITLELIKLRSEKIGYESQIHKLSDENQLLKDFYKKVTKSSSENQVGLMSANPIHNKTDSIYAAFDWSSTMIPMEGIMTESMENPVVNQSNQMAECRRQTENLRQMYEQFANEKKKWEKEYESQKAKIERDKDSLQEKNADFNKRKEILDERDEKYEQKLRDLQTKLDLYQKYGINLTDEFDALKYEKFGIQNNLIKDLNQSPHSRSHSDDISHKRSSQSPISPPLASTEIASYSVDSRPNKLEGNQIPDQLRGSLINQERQSLKTNSSDNILDTRAKQANITYSVQKPKMTPSIDRKDFYSNSNACFSIDDVEDKDWSSDIDDASYQQRKQLSNVSNQTISKPEEKPSSRYITNTPATTHVAPSNRATSMYTNPTPTLGIPLELAAKSKVKKDKSRKLFGK